MLLHIRTTVTNCCNFVMSLWSVFKWACKVWLLLSYLSFRALMPCHAKRVFFAEIVKNKQKLHTTFTMRNIICIFYIQDHAEASLFFSIKGLLSYVYLRCHWESSFFRYRLKRISHIFWWFFFKVLIDIHQPTTTIQIQHRLRLGACRIVQILNIAFSHPLESSTLFPSRSQLYYCIKLDTRDHWFCYNCFCRRNWGTCTRTYFPRTFHIFHRVHCFC